MNNLIISYIGTGDPAKTARAASDAFNAFAKQFYKVPEATYNANGGVYDACSMSKKMSEIAYAFLRGFYEARKS